jgi:BlaI family penicillinase repressor
MKRKRLPVLGSLELDVMCAVWDMKDAAVADVVRRLKPSRRLHHNTVMTVMNRLARKGLLSRYERDGRTHGFRPAVSREELSKDYMRTVTGQLFGGSLSRTIAAFLGLGKLPRGKSKQLEEIIDELRRTEK